MISSSAFRIADRRNASTSDFRRSRGGGADRLPGAHLEGTSSSVCQCHRCWKECIDAPHAACCAEVFQIKKDITDGAAVNDGNTLAREVTADPPRVRGDVMTEFYQIHCVLSGPGSSVLQALAITIRVDVAELVCLHGNCAASHDVHVEAHTRCRLDPRCQHVNI